MSETMPSKFSVQSRTPKSIRIDIPELNKWVGLLGWTNADLATAAGCNIRTIERMRKNGTLGKRSYADLLEIIQREVIRRAQRVGNSAPPEIPNSLALLDPSSEIAERHTYAQDEGLMAQNTLQAIQLLLPKEKMDSISAETRDKLIHHIKKELGMDHQVVIYGYEEGSVKIKIALSRQDAERLMKAIDAGRFECVGVQSAVLVDIDDAYDQEAEDLHPIRSPLTVEDLKELSGNYAIPLSPGRDRPGGEQEMALQTWEFRVSASDATWSPSQPERGPTESQITIKWYDSRMVVLVKSGFLRFSAASAGFIRWYADGKLRAASEWPRHPSAVTLQSKEAPKTGDTIEICVRTQDDSKPYPMVSVTLRL